MSGGNLGGKCLAGCGRTTRKGEYCSRQCADYDNAVTVDRNMMYADDFMSRRTVQWGQVIRKWGPLAALVQRPEDLD